ncbi:hypothetical protein [Bradyrhizobium sp.]|uniref:hypothetical protein n=1 Tax=Bradyrhizobium sp. TaxID=376 RepID=UPI003BB0278A
MRVAVIVVTMLVAATPSKASRSCMSKDEARQHFPTLHIYWHGADHCWDAMPSRRREADQARRKAPIREAEQQIDLPRIDQPAWRNSMSAMLPDDNLVPSLAASRDDRSSLNEDATAGTPWQDRWVNIETSPIAARWVDIAQVTPPAIVERKAEPPTMLRGVALVLFVFVLTLGTIVVLFRGTIDGRPRTGSNAGAET